MSSSLVKDPITGQEWEGIIMDDPSPLEPLTPEQYTALYRVWREIVVKYDTERRKRDLSPMGGVGL